jgi:hypothetical protein
MIKGTAGIGPETKAASNIINSARKPRYLF